MAASSPGAQSSNKSPSRRTSLSASFADYTSGLFAQRRNSATPTPPSEAAGGSLLQSSALLPSALLPIEEGVKPRAKSSAPLSDDALLSFPPASCVAALNRGTPHASLASPDSAAEQDLLNSLSAPELAALIDAMSGHLNVVLARRLAVRKRRGGGASSSSRSAASKRAGAPPSTLAAVSSDLSRHLEDVEHQVSKHVSTAAALMARHTLLLRQEKSHAARLEHLLRVNALNDCLFIWHAGPHATINGFRLARGGGGPPPTNTSSSPSSSNGQPSGTQQPSSLGVSSPGGTMPGSFYGDVRSPHADGDGDEFDDRRWQQPLDVLADGQPPGYNLSLNGGANAEQQQQQLTSVDWTEVNAALGSCALLLATMEGLRPGMAKGDAAVGWGGVDFNFTTYKIFPLCSFSKIGKRLDPTSAAAQAASQRGGVLASSAVDPALVDAVSVVYPLYTDGAFHLFSSKKANFNAGLKALLTCLMEGGIYANSHDRTMCFPYSIETDKRGELTIGGLELKIGSGGKEEEENFRRATKFFAADLKWLVAFFTKHGDA